MCIFCILWLLFTDLIYLFTEIGFSVLYKGFNLALIINNLTMIKHDNAPKRLVMGVVILLTGTTLLLRSLGFYEGFINEYIFRWEMILIAVGLSSMFSHEGPIPGVLIIIVGVSLYLKDYIHLPNGVNFGRILMAILFIVAGVLIIFHRKRPFDCGNKKGDCHKTYGSDVIDEVAVFGGGDRTVISNNFKGGKILAVFGGSSFNLTRAKLAPGNNYIDVLAVFGGLKLVVPEDWNIKISAVSIFGGFSDKHRILTPDSVNEDGPVLIIKGFLIFGGGEIKSY